MNIAQELLIDVNDDPYIYIYISYIYVFIFQSIFNKHIYYSSKSTFSLSICTVLLSLTYKANLLHIKMLDFVLIKDTYNAYSVVNWLEDCGTALRYKCICRCVCA